MGIKLAPEILRKIQLKQLEILKDVEKVCSKHNIKYYIIGGTLLGAVRHKGYIPWDDDLDIAMFRKDFNKFIEVCKSDLPEKYFLQSTQTDRNHTPPFIKIRANGTVYEEEHLKNIDTHKGVWIDIFPLDNLKNPNSIFLKTRAKFIGTLTTAIGVKNKTIKVKKLNTKIVLFLLTIFGIRVTDIIRTYIMSRDTNKTEYITNFGSNYGYLKQTMCRKVYEPAQKIRFEDTDVMAPNEYIIWLEKIYDNYMKLPPETKRSSGHIITKIKI